MSQALLSDLQKAGLGSIINKHNFSGSMYIPKEIIGPFFFFQPVVDPMDIYTKSMAKSSLTA